MGKKSVNEQSTFLPSSRTVQKFSKMKWGKLIHTLNLILPAKVHNSDFFDQKLFESSKKLADQVFFIKRCESKKQPKENQF